MNHTLKYFFLIAAAVVASGGVSAQESAPITSAFQSDIDSQVSESMPGIMAAVVSRDRNIDWSGASGYSCKESRAALLPDQTFRIASVTKTFVATAILRLWEDGKLQLESKTDMKRRGCPSPNRADSLMLSFAFPVASRRHMGNQGPTARQTFDPFAKVKRQGPVSRPPGEVRQA